MSRGTKLQVVAVLTLLIATLGFTTPASAGPATKVTVCHVDGQGNYRLINVSEKAYQAHSAHGDGTPGGDVPGMDGYVFGDDCAAIAVTAAACATLGVDYSDDGNGAILCGPVLGLSFPDFRDYLDNVWIPACRATPGFSSATASWSSGPPPVSQFGCSYR